MYFLIEYFMILTLLNFIVGNYYTVLLDMFCENHKKPFFPLLCIFRNFSTGWDNTNILL